MTLTAAIFQSCHFRKEKLLYLGHPIQHNVLVCVRYDFPIYPLKNYKPFCNLITSRLTVESTKIFFIGKDASKVTNETAVASSRQNAIKFDVTTLL